MGDELLVFGLEIRVEARCDEGGHVEGLTDIGPASADEALSFPLARLAGDRPDVLSRRRSWFEEQIDLEPERLVFIDETWTATNMTRSHGRCARGERLRMGFPHGHRKTTTLVAGLRMTGMVAPMVLDGPIDGD